MATSTNETTLINPELFDTMYFGTGSVLRNALESRGQALIDGAQPVHVDQQGVTVGIRTLNEAGPLTRLLETIDSQQGEKPEVIVVDNESKDDTVAIAKDFGATVLTLSRKNFSYPRSMNMCMEAATNNLVFLTVGHAALASSLALESAKRRFSEDKSVAGVFVPPLAGYGASRTERMLATGSLFLSKTPIKLVAKGYSADDEFGMKVKQVKKAGMGVMGSTNAVFHKQVWQDLGGFDEKLGMGGEDTLLADKMLNAGYAIVSEPLLAVHHSHGLGPINYARQVMAWNRMAKFAELQFDRDAISKRRPDLDFS